MPDEGGIKPPITDWKALRTRWVHVTFTIFEDLAGVVQFLLIGAFAFALDWFLRYAEAHTKVDHWLLLLFRVAAWLIAALDIVGLFRSLWISFCKNWRAE